MMLNKKNSVVFYPDFRKSAILSGNVRKLSVKSGYEKNRSSGFSGQCTCSFMLYYVHWLAPTPCCTSRSCTLREPALVSKSKSKIVFTRGPSQSFWAHSFSFRSIFDSWAAGDFTVFLSNWFNWTCSTFLLYIFNKSYLLCIVYVI